MSYKCQNYLGIIDAYKPPHLKHNTYGNYVINAKTPEEAYELLREATGNSSIQIKEPSEHLGKTVVTAFNNKLSYKQIYKLQTPFIVQFSDDIVYVALNAPRRENQPVLGSPTSILINNTLIEDTAVAKRILADIDACNKCSNEPVSETCPGPRYMKCKTTRIKRIKTEIENYRRKHK